MRFYLYGDGFLVRIPHAVVRGVSSPWEMINHGTVLAARARFDRRGHASHWTGLPASIYVSDDGYNLRSSDPNVSVMSAGDSDEAHRYWNQLLDRR